MKSRRAWVFGGAAVVLLVGGLLWWSVGAQRPGAGGACSADADCASGERCCADTCVAAASCEVTPAAAPQPSPDAGAAAPTASSPARERKAPPPRFKAEEPADDTCDSASECGSPLMTCDAGARRCVEPSICVGDRDCIGGRLCYHGGCVEKAEGCRQQDCPAGSYCNSTFGQCEQHACKTDEDCAGARRCEPRGFCVECLAKEDCPGQQTCVADHRCVEPERCKTDEDCRGLRVCDLETSQCSDSPCTVDALEPNNDIEHATPLVGEASFDQLVSCNNNTDFFRLDLKPGEGALVHVLFDTANGMLEVRIRDPKGKEVGRTTDIRFEGSMVAPFERVDEPTTYFLEMQSSGGIESINAPVPYAIRRHNVPGGFCLNDNFEPSDTLAEAHRIVPNQWTAARLCKGDEDWFVIDVPERDTLNIYVESIFDPAQSEQKVYLPDIEVYEEGNATPVLVNTEEDGPSHSKLAAFTSARSGPHYVRVIPAIIDVNTRYAVRLYTEPPAP
jgi:hypothetical protein